MTIFDVVAWLVHIAAVAWAWPWLTDKSRVRRPLFWLSCLLPIISWCWLVPEGLNARHRVEVEHRRETRVARRRAAVPFLQQQLIDGTLVEQENARQILQMWRAPEVPMHRPAAEVQPWLVVGGTPRAHLEPPSLKLYEAGCRCPACVSLARDVSTARAEGGYALALDQVHRQIAGSLSIPPSLLADNCPRCDVEEIHQMNGAGQVCVTQVIGQRCSAHGGDIVDVQTFYR